ncbi:putative protein SIP3 [Glarea lozoyensis 74030]|uniref:PH n=1 Tax=Glarea lozoyensis (strain ATCC 74030 / MF5533) TaxID=1104152 RepID=H0EQJ1_GLAL7|nr:putative protein SIP3 [Glarea lozoyensis 74030]
MAGSDARKYLEVSQKTFDSTLARYVGQSKTKEPSSLREDAFQVHETRKAYLKASLDFCLLAPQLRYTIDRLLVRVSADQWREMKRTRDATGANIAKWNSEMDRVRGWSKEMETGEGVFRRELQIARRDISEVASKAAQPSRELEDYNLSTVAFLGSKGPSTLNLSGQRKERETSEKQGWLFLRTISGKPARTSWVRRWFYVKNGIFGWLVQGERSGGVEESEKIGVLLCNVKPAVQEERRFCFEVKTKNQAILVQAETQGQLMEWLEAFEVAKNKALQVSASDRVAHPGGIDPAFAITAPLVPEFAAKVTDGHTSHGSDELSGPAFDRTSTLPVPGFEMSGNLATRSSFDVTAPRRSVTGMITREEGETNPPAPTNLSKAAVVVSGERGVGIGRSDATGGMPSGMMANLWGSANWSYINRLEKQDVKVAASSNPSVPPGPGIRPLEPSPKFAGDENKKPDENISSDVVQSSIAVPADPNAPTVITPVSSHRKALSVDAEAMRLQAANAPKPEVFPANYPLELKTQEAQFRMLFPNVPREEKLLLVFRATWNPNEQQEFPGRVYVTQKDFYFYSHHLGLVLITGVGMDSILEVTAAPGRDCDFIFLHLREEATKAGFTRITIKTFLEPLRLLQSRLNYLVDISQSDEPRTLEETMAALIRMENEDPSRSPSMESWEDVSMNTPIDDGTPSGRARKGHHDLRTSLHVERSLHLGRNKEVAKFQLPSQPVVYEPKDMQRKVVEKQFDISPKALFHVMFGDKSAVFQLLYHDRRAQRIAQGPWIPLEKGHMRRDFEFQIDYFDVFHRARQANVIDYQVIDVMNDHICYVITDMKTPWHLPHYKDFMLVSKIVITHVAKSKCKLAIYTKVDWTKAPTFSKGLVERQALDDSALDALDLADVITDQVRKLGPQSRTKKAIHIFGHVGVQTSVSMFSATDSMNSRKPQIKQRTLTHMVFETMSSFGESAISSVMIPGRSSAIANHVSTGAVWKQMNAGALFSSTPTRSTARRLHRTRQNLGSYRHDLIVAMRVVNSIEREMIQADFM